MPLKNGWLASVNEIPFRKHRELHITLSGRGNAQACVSQYLRLLSRKNIKTLKIVVFGHLIELDTLTNLFYEYPLLLIGNSSSVRDNTVRMNIHAVEGNFQSFEYITHRDEVIGSLYTTDGVKHLFLKNAEYADIDGARRFETETGSAYAFLARTLKTKGFAPRHIYRFWNYMDDIDCHYAAFNTVRDLYFRKWHISNYPAATAVGAQLVNNLISMSLEAVSSNHINRYATTAIQSDLQCEAPQYGPKFCRAKIVSYQDGMNVMYISGTSSINKEGKSVLAGNPDKNIAHVLSRVAHLLKKAGMCPDDIISSVAYCKNMKIFKALQRIKKTQGWDVVSTQLFSALCRKELLFELECIAVKTKVKLFK